MGYPVETTPGFKNKFITTNGVQNHRKTQIYNKYLIYISLYSTIVVFLGSILGSPLKAFPLSMISESWFSSLFRTFL